MYSIARARNVDDLSESACNSRGKPAEEEGGRGGGSVAGYRRIPNNSRKWQLRANSCAMITNRPITPPARCSQIVNPGASGCRPWPVGCATDQTVVGGVHAWRARLD